VVQLLVDLISEVLIAIRESSGLTSVELTR
jgi:hypothetical protein